MLVGGIFAKVSDMRSFASNLKEGAGVLVGLLGGIFAMVSCIR